MIRNSVPQLPIGKNHAFICRQLHGRVRFQMRPLFQWACIAPGLGASALLPGGQQNGKVGKIIIQDEPGRLPVPPGEGMAKSAVHPPEPFQFLLRQRIHRRPYIPEH